MIMATMERVDLRRMTDRDLPAADELRRLAGWNQTLEDWRRLLWLEPGGCFVAVQEDGVVGTVTTTTYGRALAWIGMMLVHPAHQRHGIGTHLMRHALDYLQSQEVSCVKLDATPAGRPVYGRLGFVPEGTLTRCQGPAVSRTQSPDCAATGVRDLTDADWEAVDEIDQAAFGAPRSRLLHSLAQASRAVLVWPERGRVAGWGMLRPGVNADYLGPLACSSVEGSSSLVAALLGRAASHSVIWDVPDQNEPAKTTAQRFGFVPLRPLTRMCLGPNLVLGNPGAQFAIADPAVG
jgi:predicted N-acetyltransferase YhbS